MPTLWNNKEKQKEVNKMNRLTELKILWGDKAKNLKKEKLKNLPLGSVIISEHDNLYLITDDFTPANNNDNKKYISCVSLSKTWLGLSFKFDKEAEFRVVKTNITIETER